LTVSTGGGNSVIVDFDSELIRASGAVTLKTSIADLKGNFAFEKSPHDNGTPGDTSDDFMAMLIAATGIEIFLGDDKGTEDTSDDFGVMINAAVIVFIKPDKTYAFEATGGAELVGISGLTLSGTLSAQKNTTGAAVQETLTAGDVTETLDLEADASGFGGSVTLQLAGFVDIYGEFTFDKIVEDTTTKIKIGVSNLSVFLGVNAGDPDEIGIKLTGGTAGILLLNNGTTSTYALSATGNVALVGLPGMVISGDVGVNINKTGTAVSETDIGLVFADGTEVFEFSIANATLEVAGIFRVSGNIMAYKTAAGSILVDIPDMSMLLTMGDTEVAGLLGAIRFSIGGTDGFALRNMQLTGFSILGIAVDDVFPADSANSGAPALLDAQSLIEELTEAERGPPAVAIDSPIDGAKVDLTVLNRQKYIDIAFIDNSETGIDTATITDTANEFTLSGTGVADAQISSVSHLSENTYRYYLTDSNPSNEPSVKLTAAYSPKSSVSPATLLSFILPEKDLPGRKSTCFDATQTSPLKSTDSPNVTSRSVTPNEISCNVRTEPKDIVFSTVMNASPSVKPLFLTMSPGIVVPSSLVCVFRVPVISNLGTLIVRLSIFTIS